MRNSILALSLFLLGCEAFNNDSTIKIQTEKPNSTLNDSLGSATEKVEASLIIQDLGNYIIHPLSLKLLAINNQFIENIKSSGLGLDTQTTFKELLLTYRELHALQLKPHEEIVPFIYSYPQFNSCLVDQNVAHFHTHREVMDKTEFQAQGLMALEYLLFFPDSSRCNRRRYPQVHAWLELSSEEKTQDRKDLSLALAELLKDQFLELEQIWNPVSQDGVRTLQELGPQKSLNDLSDALIKIEDLKNLTVATPLGQHRNCLNWDDFCPRDIEHRFSNWSFEGLRAQLIGFKRGFFGTTGRKIQPGLDDLLIKACQQSVVDDIARLTNATLTRIDSLMAQGSMSEIIASSTYAKCEDLDTPTEMCLLIEDLKQLIRTYKSRVLITLSLQAPPTYQGDGDGGTN